VSEAVLAIEDLLSDREQEVLTAIHALEPLVLVGIHVRTSGLPRSDRCFRRRQRQKSPGRI
jgi:hypothetical protein